MLWCNAGTEQHLTWTPCPLFFCVPTCFCMHVYPVSALAPRPVSLEPDMDGWMDGRRRGTTLHITRPGSPAKQTLSDWWLPSFGVALSKPSAHPPNHRQWTARQPLDSVFYTKQAVWCKSLLFKRLCFLCNHVSLLCTFSSSSTEATDHLKPWSRWRSSWLRFCVSQKTPYLSLRQSAIYSSVWPPNLLHRRYSIRGEMNISTWAALEHVEQRQRCSR